MKRYLPFAIIAFVLAVAIGAGFYMFRSEQPQPSTTQASNAKASVSPTTSASKGAVIVEEFGDYQCPPCGSLHPEMKKLKSEFGNRIRFIFYHLPLTVIHKNALDAAHAAVAAGLQGKFWEMHDMLYDSQKAWEETDNLRPIVAGYAGRLGLDVQKFLTDMDGPQVEATVAADVRRANSLGVTGTPTLFVDGQEINNDDLTTENLRKIINQRLSVRQ